MFSKYKIVNSYIPQKIRENVSLFKKTIPTPISNGAYKYFLVIESEEIREGHSLSKNKSAECMRLGLFIQNRQFLIFRKNANFESPGSRARAYFALVGVGGVGAQEAIPNPYWISIEERKSIYSLERNLLTSQVRK